MPVPPFNLQPALDEARPAIDANLARLFTRMQFILGEQLAAFEREFAAAHQARFAVGVANGTQAIELALRHAGITRGAQQVIAPALTAPFTAVGIAAAGARPVFCDVDPETLGMDPEDMESRIRRTTSGVVAVHLYGNPCPIGRIAALARARGLTLVQDACQAHGARFQGKPLSAYSRYVAYSFYPTKNLGALGDGGALLTNSPAIHKGLGMLRDGGRKPGTQVSHTAGINSRLDEMQCCYLRAFLPRLDEWNCDRARTAALYDAGLGDCPGVRLVRRSADSVCHLYVIRAARRDRLREFLAGRGIGTGIHYPVPLHLHPAFAACGQKKGSLPHAEKACGEILSLPLWPRLPESAAREVVDGVRAFYRR